MTKPVLDPVVPEHLNQYQGIETYAEINEIMGSLDFHMAGGEERTVFLGGCMTMSEGQDHSRQKQDFAPLMSRQALAHYELHLVDPVIQAILADVRANRKPGEVARVDVVTMVHDALARISASVTGVDGVDTPARIERFRDLVLSLSECTTGTFSTKPLEEMIQRGKFALAALAEEYLQASLDRRIDLVRQHREGRLAREDLPRDLLTLMCLNDDLTRPDDGERIPYVWRQCAQFLTASVKTTSHSLPHVFVHLGEWLQEHPEDRAKLTDVDFLRQAASESFRLHQTAPARFRIAVKDVTLSTGRKVAEGELVILHAPRANVQAEVFGEDGRHFNPYRSVPDDMHPWGMSFGLGRHSCFGRNLVTGIRNRGDEKHGTQGTAIRIMSTLYELGAELDPDNPPLRPENTLHDTWESVPMVLTRL